MGRAQGRAAQLNWTIALTPTARQMLEGIRDRRVQATIRKRIDALVDEPDKQGTPLLSELSGYRSVRAVGQRYRVIYRIEEDRVLVVVVAVGIRREGAKSDVYELARKLFRMRLLDPGGASAS